MPDPSDPLSAFRRPGHAPTLSMLTKTGNKETYEAFRVSTTERRFLEVRPKFPESAEAIHNGMITSVVGEWRMGLGVTITYGTSMVIDIKGENLQELFRGVQNWKIEYITEFDPDWHVAPTDKDAPLIRSITIHTHKPESPPPVEKRH